MRLSGLTIQSVGDYNKWVMVMGRCVVLSFLLWISVIKMLKWRERPSHRIIFDYPQSQQQCLHSRFQIVDESLSFQAYFSFEIQGGQYLLQLNLMSFVSIQLKERTEPRHHAGIKLVSKLTHTVLFQTKPPWWNK